MHFARSCNSGYSKEMDLAERATSLVVPSSITASARIPSHLISKSQSSLENGFSLSDARAGCRLPSAGIGDFRALVRSCTPLENAEVAPLPWPCHGGPGNFPLFTDCPYSSMSQSVRTYSSRCLINSHSFCFLEFFNLTRTKLPLSFCPCKTIFRSPFRNCSSADREPSVV